MRATNALFLGGLLPFLVAHRGLTLPFTPR